MTHAMVKGSNIPLAADAVRAVLSWSSGPSLPDVDVSALLLGEDGKVRSDADFVFYNQPRHPTGLVRHLARAEDEDGWSDGVEMDVASLEPDVVRVVLAASTDGGTFGQVDGLRVRLYDQAPDAGGEPLAAFDIEPDTGEEAALICGEFYRRDGGWKFRALGQGYASGLVGLATEFGILVEDEDEDEDEAPEPGRAAGPAAPEPPAPAGSTPPGGQGAPAGTAAAAATAPLPQLPPAPVEPPTAPVVPPPSAPAGAPTGYGGYGYPPAPVPGYGYPPPQPGGYGFPQTAPPPAAAAGPQQGYGYAYPGYAPARQPAAPGQQPLQATAFALPPQGPQFQRRGA